MIVSDAPLLDVNLNPSCGNSTPTDVLIRNMTSTVTVYQCLGPVADPCSVRVAASTADTGCRLSAKFNLDSYPSNLPPDGTPFNCTDPIIIPAGAEPAATHPRLTDVEWVVRTS